MNCRRGRRPTRGRRTTSVRACLALVVLLALAAAPSGAATLLGRVTNRETGEPLPYASVQVVGAAASLGRLADENGEWRLEGVPGGAATVRVDFIGYKRLEQEVRLGPDPAEERRVDAALVPAPIAMEKVEIRADRTAREQDVRPSLLTLGGRQVEALPALGERDPIRALTLLPGVQAASDISSGLYVRGGGPDQNLILLDDVPVYNPTHAFGIFSAFNADLIDEVRLYKGAYPARWGGRLGAVLDVRSRDDRPRAFNGRGAVSTTSGRLRMEGPAGAGDWVVGARRTYLDPILDALSTRENPLPAYYFYDLNGRLTLPDEHGNEWSFGGYAGDDRMDFLLEEDSRIKLGWGNRTGSARYRKVLGRHRVATMMLSGSEYESTTDVVLFSTPLSVSNRLRDFTAQGGLAWSNGHGLEVKSGLAASAYDFRYRESFDRNDQTDFTSSPFEVAAYAETEWTRPGSAVYGGGVRLRRLSEGDRFLAEPRASASWPVGDAHRLKLAGGIYHQPVQLVSTEAFSAGDFYLPVGKDVPLPRSLQGVAGWEWQASERYQLSVESFYTRLTNLLALDLRQSGDRSAGDTETTFATGGTGWASGVELFLQRRTGNVTGWIGYTLGWTRRTFADLNGGKAFAPKYDRRHDLSVVATRRFGKWSYGGTFVFATGQAYTPVNARYDLADPATGAPPTDGRVLPGEKNSARLLPYHRLDVSVARRFDLFGQPAEWSFQIFNLYNRHNEWFIQFDPQGTGVEPEVVHQLPFIPTLGLQVDF